MEKIEIVDFKDPLKCRKYISINGSKYITHNEVVEIVADYKRILNKNKKLERELVKM